MGNNRGQVLIEAAIILPLLLLLIFGIVDYSRAMFTKNTLTNAARSGARAAVVTSPLSPVTPAASLSKADGEPAKSIQKSLSGLVEDAHITYEVNIYDSSGNPVGTAHNRDQVRVTLTYPNFTMITPLAKLVSIITNSASEEYSSITITGEASMRYE